MTEWGVVGVIVALAGFLAIILPPVIRLTSSVTRLNAEIMNTVYDLKELHLKNSDTHGRIFSQLGEHTKEIAEHDKQIHVHDKELGNHEKRIHVLEISEKGQKQ